MTQRIFDVENEKDMQDLWDILPEYINKIKKNKAYNTYSSDYIDDFYETSMLKINWHDKTEITRPIQEATEADIGKLCYFWDYDNYTFGILEDIDKDDVDGKFQMNAAGWWIHCRRMTKQEIEEMC